MSNDEFQKLVLTQFEKINDRFDTLETELKEVKKEVREVKEIVLRTEEQTKDNTEFIHAVKEISKK